MAEVTSRPLSPGQRHSGAAWPVLLPAAGLRRRALPAAPARSSAPAHAAAAATCPAATPASPPTPTGWPAQDAGRAWRCPSCDGRVGEGEADAASRNPRTSAGRGRHQRGEIVMRAGSGCK
ncbi:hypothetical protein G6F31_021159 [Rhizopus arrhizus]|nr:hypothetical protein G6F31_021159 [Rhizopus arrhizus]